MEEEAEQLQMQVQQSAPTGGVITVVRETDWRGSQTHDFRETV